MVSADSSDDASHGTAEGVGDLLDKDFFQSLVENGSDAIVSIDEDSRILFANNAVEEVFGYEPSELVGEDLTVIMPTRFQAAHHEALADYIRTGERNLDWRDIQLPAEHADGHEIQLDITFEEHRYEGKRVFSGIMRDITERVAREKRLERQRDKLERFASIVSHDLRDPLQSAKSCVAVARAGGGDEEVLADLDASLDRMDELIDDVLTLAKQGRAVGETEWVDLQAAAEDAWRTVDAGGAELVVDGPLGTVESDEERLRTLLQNLFRNSLEHGAPDDRTASGDDADHDDSAASDDGAATDEPLTVTVSTLPDGDGFAVADDGVGFDVDDTDQLFEYGYTGSPDGTGFGLSIVDDVATALGWTVTATESAAGGARFEFRGVKRGEQGTR